MVLFLTCIYVGKYAFVCESLYLCMFVFVQNLLKSEQTQYDISCYIVSSNKCDRQTFAYDSYKKNEHVCSHLYSDTTIIYFGSRCAGSCWCWTHTYSLSEHYSLFFIYFYCITVLSYILTQFTKRAPEPCAKNKSNIVTAT